MKIQALVLKIIISILAIPLVLLLLQGLLFPFLLLFSESPETSTYLISIAVLFGWVGLIGLLFTVYTLGTKKSPSKKFVSVTFLAGTIGLAIAVYAFSYSSFIMGLALVIFVLSAYTLYLWSKFKSVLTRVST